jgi:hypothetical protein
MLCTFVLLAVPAGAAAKPGCHGSTVSPHGNSEADQYSETIPGACGNHPPNAGNPAGSPNGTVPTQTLNRLESLGAGGRNAAALAQANAPAGARGQGGAGGSRGGANANQAGAGEAGDGGGALSGVGRALGGSPGDDEGMGFVLPLVLAGTLVAGIAYWLMRRRRAGPAS